MTSENPVYGNVIDDPAETFDVPPAMQVDTDPDGIAEPEDLADVDVDGGDLIAFGSD